MQTDKDYLDDNFDYSEDEDLSIEEVKSEESPNVKSEESTIEIKVEESKPKKKKVSVNRKRKTEDEKAQRKLVSISEKNRKVLEILREVKKGHNSESDYICQAIIEKYEREQSGKSTNLENIVKDILEEMVGEKYIIMKSSSDIINVQNQVQPQPVVNETKEPVPEEAEADANHDLIRGAMDMWDD